MLGRVVTDATLPSSFQGINMITQRAISRCMLLMAAAIEQRDNAMDDFQHVLAMKLQAKIEEYNSLLGKLKKRQEKFA